MPKVITDTVGKTKKERAVQRWDSLKQERASWMAHWEEISTYVLPRNGRYFPGSRNDGTRKHNSIYDSTGTKSLRVLAAGMMAGMTSPARPWFRLSTSDPDLNKHEPVKIWLNEVTSLMLTVFAKSNTYRALHSVYEELGAFGTAATIVLPDFQDVIRHYPLTIGEYAIATDYRGQVNTLYREFDKRVGELVEEFGIDRVSNSTRMAWERGNLDQWVRVLHAIEPRSDRDPRKRDAKNMAWSSCYFELSSDKNDCLRESGFVRFPAMVPRWAVAGGDIYGNSPGMETLGDVKQLQHEQLRKAEGIDYKTKPPLQVPSSMKNRDVETLPGGVTFVDMNSPSSAIKTAFEVNLDLSHLLNDIQDVRERIKGGYFADLFLMFAQNPNTRMTATEVAERHEEKLLMLGPTLERLQNELLSPMIDITFERMIETGVLPPPPEELQGMDLSVQFVSMLAQAQRAIGTNSVDRYVGALGVVAGMKPDVLDRFDSDKWAEDYADMLGVNPELVVPDEDVAALRQQRAQMAQQQMQAEQMAQASQTAKNLGTTPSAAAGDSALTDVTRAFSGYT